MSGEGAREAALRGLVDAARAEAAPELDWAGIEQRLLREAQRSAPPATRSLYPYAWGALAVAAAAALWLVGTRTLPSTLPAPSPSYESSGPVRASADAAEVGTRYQANAGEVTVAHAGRAEWTLAVGSSALLAGKGEVIRVQLERGSVLSQVVPNPKPETFIVEAARARIAVHGTVFRVALEGGRVLVDVREGTVGVGPLGKPSAFMLEAPAHGDFAADGLSGTIDGRAVPVRVSQPHVAGPQKSTPGRGASPLSPSSSAAPAVSAPPPAEPSISEIEAGIARIVEATSDCFAQHTQSANGVQITVHTALSLKVLGSGSVADLDFQPPLSPAAEQCAAARISQVHFAASEQGARVTRMLELKK